MSESAVVGVTSSPDALVVEGLTALQPVFEQCSGSLLVVGGLMARLWLHAEPVGLAPRSTADIDLGVDRQNLRIAGNRRVIGPLLEAHDFKPGAGDEAFRFTRDFQGQPLIVDLVVAPGASREEPPIVERGLPTLAAPGLAYALLRGPTLFHVRFFEDEESLDFELPVPTLDAALVLKAALAASGVRTRPDRLLRDTVDALMLAAACVKRPGCTESLRAHRRRSDVKKALGWLADAFRSPTAVGARRVSQHFEAQMAPDEAREWSHQVVRQLLREIRNNDSA